MCYGFQGVKGMHFFLHTNFGTIYSHVLTLWLVVTIPYFFSHIQSKMIQLIFHNPFHSYGEIIAYTPDSIFKKPKCLVICGNCHSTLWGGLCFNMAWCTLPMTLSVGLQSTGKLFLKKHDLKFTWSEFLADRPNFI